ncbi:MAG: hypothetical protein ACE5JG_01935 [Planctomycetota bacterium]
MLFCLGLLAGSGGSLLPSAGAQEGGGGGGGSPVVPVPVPVPVPDPFGGRPATATGERLDSRTVAPTASDSDSNQRFVAVTMPISGGGSILCLLDGDNERLLMYQYQRRAGLQLIAARHIDYDLRLQGYLDASQYTREQLRKLYEKEQARAAAKAGGKKN